MFLGSMLSANAASLFQYGHRYVVFVGFGFLCLTVWQLFRGSYWKQWAFALFCAGVGVCSMLINILSHV